MSARALEIMRCGNCGADVPITSPATVTVTCEHCGRLSLRRDVELADLGRVALPARLASHFQVGTEGRFDGRPFVVRGQLQLDHGAGLWNEWAAETDDGWLWIAEAQGEVHVYEERSISHEALAFRDRLPEIDPSTGDFDPSSARSKRWSAGTGVKLFEHGRWTVVEIGRGTPVACRGEFPIEIELGERTTYVDLAKGSAGVATLDFTRPGPPEFLSGRRVLVADLDLDPSTLPEHRPSTIESRPVTCPACGGTIEVQDEEHALTLGCVHCSTTLSRGTHLDAYEAAEGAREIRRRPDLPIGARGTLRGEPVTVLGYLRRGVWAEGSLWPWSEYLLRTDDGAYRWLVESDGHWVLAVPTSLASVERNGQKAEYAGTSFRHFSGGRATVDTVLGEFYWQVRAGDAVQADDFIDARSGTMVSLEVGPLEAAASRAVHVDPRALAEAFPDAGLPRPRGVGVLQPNPVSASSVWTAFVLLALLLTGSCVGVRIHHANEVVHRATYGPTPAAVGEEVVQFSDPFRIEAARGNVKVTVRATSLNQGYLDVLGALVNADTGEVTTFATAAQYYSGVSGGERWSEGNRKGGATLGRIPAGTYRLRLAARGYDSALGTSYEVVLRNQVPSILWFVLALVGLLVWPILQSIRKGAFEAQRWSKSDHAG